MKGQDILQQSRREAIVEHDWSNSSAKSAILWLPNKPQTLTNIYLFLQKKA
jgi:hypothetical protein